MAKTRYDKITRFDKGIRNSSRLVSDGAFEMVKGFDIFSDPLKAIPVKGWASEVSTEDKAIGFKSVEASGDYLYACGSAITNWLAPNWPYRVRLTASGSTGKIHFFDLSNMPANFWDNATGLTATLGTSSDEIKLYVGNFDAVAKTGYILVANYDDIYLYYGATSGPHTGTGNLEGISDGFEACAWLENDDINYGRNAFDFDNPSTPNPTFVPGAKLEYALASDIYTDSTQFVTGDDGTMVALFTTGDSITNDYFVLFDGGFDISIAASKFAVNIRCTGTDIAFGCSTTLQPNTEYLVVVKMIETSGPTTEVELYLNGVLDGSGSIAGNLDFFANQNRIQGNANAKFDFVQYWNDPITVEVAGLIYDMWMDNANYWTVGTEELYSAITPIYDGIGIWRREISGDTWGILTNYGGTATNLTWYPTNGKMLPNNGNPLFVNTTAQDQKGIAYFAAYNTFNGYDPTVDVMGTLGVISGAMPMMAQPEDKQNYLGFYSDVYSVTSSSASEEQLNTFSTIQSMNNFIDSLAFISTQNDKAWVEYWGLNDPESDQVFDLGRGKGRVVANVGGTLMAVVNNFIDDDSKSGTRKTMDIRKLNGLDFSTHATIEAKGSMDGYYTNSWDQPVGQHTAIIDSFTTLFYAKIPTNPELTEFLEGLWSLSKNQVTEEISLALYAETPGKNVNYLTSVGNIPYIIHSENGSVESLTGDYDLTSEIITKVFNGRDDQSTGDSETQKKLVAVQITHEKLSEGQSIAVYYRKDGDEIWTKIGENTTADSLSKEYTNITSNGTALPIYKEIQYKIESKGGASAITGFKARYEELTNNYA